MRSEGSHLDFRLVRKADRIKTFSKDGVCILPGLADGKADHVLGLGAIEL